jgi:hypothetical protein
VIDKDGAVDVPVEDTPLPGVEEFAKVWIVPVEMEEPEGEVERAVRTVSVVEDAVRTEEKELPDESLVVDPVPEL